MRARAASPSDARSFTHSAMRRVEAPDAALSSADANSRQFWKRLSGSSSSARIVTSSSADDRSGRCALGGT
jgi:hypothetical protein